MCEHDDTINDRQRVRTNGKITLCEVLYNDEDNYNAATGRRRWTR